MGFARFKSAQTNSAPMADINVTPLVDVMLVLLVIFMLAAPVVTTAIRLQLPQSGGAASTSPPNIIKISIDAQSRVFWQDKLLAENELAQRLAQLHTGKKTAQLQLYIDRSVPYEVIANVMALAQQHGQQQLVFMTEAEAKNTK